VDFLLNREDVLLVIWRNDPFKGYLSLPCGFKYEKQKVEKAVKKEAKEELTLEEEPIKILDVFSEPLRDPMGIL
jgi:8-oxo-dGTP diphosphatase